MVQVYTFNIQSYNTQSDTIENGYGRLQIYFDGVSPAVLAEISENIKSKIKEDYSIKMYDKSCFDKTKSFWKGSVPPPKLFNFIRLDKTPFTDENGYDVILTITINETFVKYCKIANLEQLDVDN